MELWVVVVVRYTIETHLNYYQGIEVHPKILFKVEGERRNRSSKNRHVCDVLTYTVGPSTDYKIRIRRTPNRTVRGPHRYSFVGRTTLPTGFI